MSAEEYWKREWAAALERHGGPREAWAWERDDARGLREAMERLYAHIVAAGMTSVHPPDLADSVIEAHHEAIQDAVLEALKAARPEIVYREGPSEG